MRAIDEYWPGLKHPVLSSSPHAALLPSAAAQSNLHDPSVRYAARVVLPAYGAGPYLPTIVLDRPIYIREMSDGLYTPLTYLTYKVSSQEVGIKGKVRRR